MSARMIRAKTSPSAISQIGPEQVVIAFRETDQTLVTTAADYLANCKTKYRNWRLYGDAAFIELPVIAARFVGVELGR